MSNVRELPQRAMQNMANEAAQAAQSISPSEALQRMTSQLQNVEEQIAQAKGNYTNSYLSIACDVAKALVKESKSIDEAVSTGFAFMEAFRAKAVEEDARLRSVAPVPQSLQNQKLAMESNLQQVQSLIDQQKEQYEKMQAQVKAEQEAKGVDVAEALATPSKDSGNDSPARPEAV